MKFLVCTAMRVAVSTHVAEILRDAGPKVVFIPIHHFIVGADLLLYRENKSAKSPNPPRFTVEN
jgi:hypothetical protein